jgi:MurNAc alpha-1-phosphate uridylyltransferase
MDPVGRLKRRQPHQIAPYVYTGLHIASPRLFEGAPDGSYSLNRLWDRAEAAGRLYGLLHDGAWFHVGTPEALAETDALLDERRARWLEP